MRRLLAFLVILLLVGAAAVPGGHEAFNYWFDGTKWVETSATNPFPVNASVAPLTSTNLSSTVAVTNTFQSIQVLTAGRNGCAIQNNDTNTMWVFFGAIAGATKAKSVVLAAGQSVACAVGGIGVLTDQISITGTATGVFFASVQ